MSRKTAPLRSRIKEATNQEILVAAEQVLAEHGVRDTTMALVAKKAGVAVGTLYNYFKDRDQLFRVLHLQRREQFFVALTSTVEGTAGQPFTARLEAVVNCFAEQYDTHRAFTRLIFSGELPIGLKADKPPLMDFAARLVPLLEDGVKEKVIAPGNLMLYAASLASIVRGMFIACLAENTPMADAMPFVTSLFLKGVGNR